MLSEVALAFARCRGKPSFLPILEQLGTFSVEQVPELEPEMVTEIMSTTTSPPLPPTTATNSPVKELPLVVFQKPVAPQVVRNNSQQFFFSENLIKIAFSFSLSICCLRMPMIPILDLNTAIAVTG